MQHKTQFVFRYNQEVINGIVQLKKNSAEVFFPVEDFVVGKSIYKLRAIVMHSGTLDAGHYTAACRNLQDNEYAVYFYFNLTFFNFFVVGFTNLMMNM